MGRSPVDRGKQGRKRSTVIEARGIPLGTVAAGANRHDFPLLGPTLDTLDRLGPLPQAPTVHLDRGYDRARARSELAGRGMRGQIAEKGTPAPIPLRLDAVPLGHPASATPLNCYGTR